MLIRNINSIKMMPDLQKKGYYTYVSRQVVDTEATSAARAACNADWNNKITELNELMIECRTHINQINSLQTEIGEKMTALDELDSQFKSVQNYVNNANINYDIEDGTLSCMSTIKGELTTMSQNCKDQLEEFKTKYENAKLAKKDAMLERKNCSLITKYKTITEQVWIQ